jgi:Mrp family chromosome partitioning ATPase
MIPLRTPRTQGHFDSAIEQLLNRLIRVPNRPKSILITSALPQEGKTTTAQALAEAAQSRGMRVVLIDADMRSMRVVRQKVSHQIGLSDVLRGDADVHSVTTRQPDTGVSRVSAGSPRGNPTRLMALPTLGVALADLTAANDLVIVDAPPTLVGGDCEVLAQSVDTTVMLAKWGSTAPETVALALKMLDAKVAGLVLTMVDPAKIRRSGLSEAVLYRKELYDYYK